MHNSLEETSLILQEPAALSSFPDPVKTLGSLKEALFVSSVQPQAKDLERWRSVPGFDVQIHPGVTGPVALLDLAASSAKGRYLVFLSNDIKPGPGWLEKIVRPVAAGEAAAAASPANNIKRPEPLPSAKEGEAWILAPPFRAFCMAASWYRHVGGFDRDLEGPHALTDLGFRLWITGGRMIRAGSCMKGAKEKKEADHYATYREVRDRLCTIYKNYETGDMASHLSLHILQSLRRSAALSHLEVAFFSFPRRAGETPGRTPVLEPQALASLLGIQYLTANLSRLRLKRAAVQQLRKVRDRDIFSLTGDPFTISNTELDAPAGEWRIIEDILHIPVSCEEAHGGSGTV